MLFIIFIIIFTICFFYFKKKDNNHWASNVKEGLERMNNEGLISLMNEYKTYRKLGRDVDEALDLIYLECIRRGIDINANEDE